MLKILCDIYSWASKIFILPRVDVLYRFTISQLRLHGDRYTMSQHIFHISSYNDSIVYFFRIKHLMFHIFFIFVFFNNSRLPYYCQLSTNSNVYNIPRAFYDTQQILFYSLVLSLSLSILRSSVRSLDSDLFLNVCK